MIVTLNILDSETKMHFELEVYFFFHNNIIIMDTDAYQCAGAWWSMLHSCQYRRQKLITLHVQQVL